MEQEPDTVRWFALRFGPSSFGIYDAFPDDSGRQTHLSGQVAKALTENIGTLFGLWGAKTKPGGPTCDSGRRGFALVDQAAEYSPTANGSTA